MIQGEDMIDRFKQEFRGKSAGVEKTARLKTTDLVSSLNSSNSFLAVTHGCNLEFFLCMNCPKFLKTKIITLKNLLNNFISNPLKYSGCKKVKIDISVFKCLEELLAFYPNHRSLN